MTEVDAGLKGGFQVGVYLRVCAPWWSMPMWAGLYVKSDLFPSSYYVTHLGLSPVACLDNKDSVDVKESLSEAFPPMTQKLVDLAMGDSKSQS